MHNLSCSLSETEEGDSPRQLSYSRLGAEVDQEERLNTRSRGQNKKLLELPQKTTTRHIDKKSEKEADIVSKDGPNIKINYSYSLTKPMDLATSNTQQESKEPCSHSMMTKSGMDKLKQGLRAIQEKRQEDELGSSEKSVLVGQIMNKIIIQNPCHSSQVHQQHNKKKNINQVQSLTHRTNSHLDKKNVVIRPIDDSIQYEIQQEPELIQTSDRFTIPTLPQVKQEGPAVNEVYKQVTMLGSLTTQSNKYVNNNEDELKKSYRKSQLANKKTQKEEQNEILQKIKSLETLVRQLKQKRDVAQRQDQIQNKYVKEKLEEEIVQIKKRLNNLQNKQKSNSHIYVQRESRSHQIPNFKINFLQQCLSDKVWQKFDLLDKLQIKQKSSVLSQILRSLNIDIQLEIVKEKNQIVALCEKQRQFAVIATKAQLYYGPYMYQHQKYIKQGYGLSFLPKTQAYTGYFHKNKRQGKGLLITLQREIFQGEFFNDLKHGYGKHLFKNGDVYQGNYQQNKFHGYGLYIWKNGDFYQGQFKTGNMDGTGKWWSRNGDLYVGEYKNGLKQGWGIYTFASGKQFEGQFYKGKRLKDKVKYKLDKIQINPQGNFIRTNSCSKPIQMQNLNHHKNSRRKLVGSSIQRFRICFN